MESFPLGFQLASFSLAGRLQTNCCVNDCTQLLCPTLPRLHHPLSLIKENREGAGLVGMLIQQGYAGGGIRSRVPNYFLTVIEAN